MRGAGVEPLLRSEDLAVVGLVEVIRHIPRIYREYRKLVRAAVERKPDLAILTDSPDFHFRVAKQLKKRGIPVLYLVAPQVWAWRRGRLAVMRRTIDRLLCIFPFEEPFFQKYGLNARYIGHPLARIVHASAPAIDLRAEFGVPPDAAMIALLPGSREGEIVRHLPILVNALRRITATLGAGGREVTPILALPPGMASKFRERFLGSSIQVREGKTWDVLACCDVALAASGTVTIEACLLGAPMVTFYRVNGLSWFLGKLLVRVPYYSMVNLVAGRQVVPELIQAAMTPQRLADEACRLLASPVARQRMREDLNAVARTLSSTSDPMEVAASIASEFLDKEMVHVS